MSGITTQDYIYSQSDNQPIHTVKDGQDPFYVKQQDSLKQALNQQKVKLARIAQGPGSTLNSDQVDGFNVSPSSSPTPNTLVPLDNTGKLPSSVLSSIARSQIRYQGGNGMGSTNTAIRRFNTQVISQGTDITFADSATAGSTFTINTTGYYAIHYSDYNSAAVAIIGISVNSNQLTTSIASITNTHRYAQVVSVANGGSCCSVTAYLTAGAVVRGHCSPSGSNPPNAGTTDGLCQFHIIRLA